MLRSVLIVALTFTIGAPVFSQERSAIVIDGQFGSSGTVNTPITEESKLMGSGRGGNIYRPENAARVPLRSAGFSAQIKFLAIIAHQNGRAVNVCGVNWDFANASGDVDPDHVLLERFEAYLDLNDPVVHEILSGHEAFDLLRDNAGKHSVKIKKNAFDQLPRLLRVVFLVPLYELEFARRYFGVGNGFMNYSAKAPYSGGEGLPFQPSTLCKNAMLGAPGQNTFSENSSVQMESGTNEVDVGAFLIDTYNLGAGRVATSNESTVGSFYAANDAVELLETVRAGFRRTDGGPLYSATGGDITLTQLDFDLGPAHSLLLGVLRDSLNEMNDAVTRLEAEARQRELSQTQRANDAERSEQIIVAREEELQNALAYRDPEPSRESFANINARLAGKFELRYERILAEEALAQSNLQPGQGSAGGANAADLEDARTKRDALSSAISRYEEKLANR